MSLLLILRSSGGSGISIAGAALAFSYVFAPGAANTGALISGPSLVLSENFAAGGGGGGTSAVGTAQIETLSLVAGAPKTGAAGTGGTLSESLALAAGTPTTSSVLSGVAFGESFGLSGGSAATGGAALGAALAEALALAPGTPTTSSSLAGIALTETFVLSPGVGGPSTGVNMLGATLNEYYFLTAGYAVAEGGYQILPLDLPDFPQPDQHPDLRTWADRLIVALKQEREQFLAKFGALDEVLGITYETSTSERLDKISDDQGSILYRGATDWLALAPGTSGHFLKSNGPGANPSYAAQDPTVVSKYFESAQQTIGSATLLTLAHGLGVIPKFVYLELVCTTANAGFSIGDTLTVGVNNGDEATARYMNVYYDTTNIFVRFPDTATSFHAATKTTGAHVTLNNASWKLVVRALA